MQAVRWPRRENRQGDYESGTFTFRADAWTSAPALSSNFAQRLRICFRAGASRRGLLCLRFAFLRAQGSAEAR